MIGIYLIKNTVNGHSYVGQSRSIKLRWSGHKSHTKSHPWKTLSRAFVKYGLIAFEFSVLEECQAEALNDREKFWIARLQPEYNRTTGGDGSPGHVVSPATRERLAVIGRQAWLAKSDSERAAFVARNLSGPAIGHGLKPSTRQRISDRLTGRTLPQGQRDKIGMGNRIAMRGNHNGNKPVCQLDPRGHVIAYFQSAKAAAVEVGICPTGITKVISGEQQTAGGFHWQSFTTTFYQTNN